MALTRFVILVALLAVSYAQYLDVDSVNIDTPSEFYDGVVFDVQFDVTFTPTMGAADIIEASDAATRFMPILTLSNDGETLDLDASCSVNLTEAQQLEDMTDDDSVTWNNLATTCNLTDLECGNGTVYQYACVSLMPYPGVSWGAVDTSNSSMCISFICKAEADVTITTNTMTNPDDAVIGVGGGQAIEFDIVVDNSDSSDDVVGSTNYLVKSYLSDAATGGSSVALTTVSLSSAQAATDLVAGTTNTLSGLAVTLDLEDVTCDDFTHFCASVAPASSSYWKRPSSASDNYLCIEVTCSACVVKTSMTVMVVAVLLNFLFKH